MLFATHLIGFGSGELGEWKTIYNTATTTSGTGWTGYMFRNIFAPAGFVSPPGSGSVVRVTASAVGALGSMSISGAYVGHAAVSGDVYDFDGNQVQLTWSGSGVVTVAAGATALSDEIAFTFDSARPLIVSLGFSANNTARTTSGLPSGFAGYDLLGGSASVGTTNVSGMGSTGYLVAVSKIEIFG